MFSQYFGTYLLNKGFITPEQLENALEVQNYSHVKFGVLAINAGFMSPQQIEEVHRLQMRADKKFGQISVELGYLTSEQLDELISTQKKGHLLLSQALLDKGYLSLEELQSAINNYKQDYGLSNEQFNAIQQGDINVVLKSILKYRFAENKLFYDYISLLVRNIIRFMDDVPRLEDIVEIEDYKTQWFIHQEICGPVNIFTGFAVDTESFVELAGKYAGENFNQADEYAQASLAEFLNLHNGIFLVNMSNNGIELDMKPQVVSSGVRLELNNPEEVSVISFNLSKVKFDLVISVSSVIRQ